MDNRDKFISVNDVLVGTKTFKECYKENEQSFPLGFVGFAYNVLDMVEEFVNKAPPADVVKVVHGEWIPSDIDIEEYEECMSDTAGWYDWECSICYYQVSYVDPVERRHLTPYCPNCGAKMNGDNNGD